MDIRQAREILGLPEKATLQQIKQAYRRAVKSVHPDISKACGEDLSEAHKRTEEIIKAYKCLLEYCSNYEYDLDVDIDVEKPIRTKTRRTPRFYDW